MNLVIVFKYMYQRMIEQIQKIICNLDCNQTKYVFKIWNRKFVKYSRVADSKKILLIKEVSKYRINLNQTLLTRSRSWEVEPNMENVNIPDDIMQYIINNWLNKTELEINKVENCSKFTEKEYSIIKKG